MSLLSNFMKLLDEESDEAFEKKILGAIDKIEQTLGASLDKAESGLRRADSVVSQALKSGETTVKKIDSVAQKTGHTMDIIRREVNKPGLPKNRPKT